MRKTKQILTLTAGVIASVMTAQANLVVNGSFETVPTGFSNNGAVAVGAGSWDYYTSILGWTPDPNAARPATVLEVGKASVYGVTGQDGQNVMEVDTTANVRALQVLATPNTLLKVSFLYALRSGVDGTSGGLRVTYDGNLIDDLAPNSTVMTPYSFYVTGTGATDSIRFIGLGTSDSYGALVDAVTVIAVPEPSTYFAAALLGLPLVVSAVRSRMVKTA